MLTAGEVNAQFHYYEEAKYRFFEIQGDKVKKRNIIGRFYVI